MTSKPFKVLIIGSGPIKIGPSRCHSEGVKRPKNLGVGIHTYTIFGNPLHPDTLRYTQGDIICVHGDKIVVKITQRDIVFNRNN